MKGLGLDDSESMFERIKKTGRSLYLICSNMAGHYKKISRESRRIVVLHFLHTLRLLVCAVVVPKCFQMHD